ncbi:MAG TPA: IucA/IucC family siderophore biosynthesis protein [Actinoplanes sp.]|nr:IucA/IucC family siderophore biosynthesis protein [Actinoplanes sp.]
MPHPTADVDGTRQQLTTLRPALVDAYDAAVPGARAAVLNRLLTALEHEPLPGLVTRHHHNGDTHVRFTRTTVTYPTADATPFTEPATAFTDPAQLAARLWPGHRLTTEIANSVANLALARAAATTGTSTGPGVIEQSLVDGHPLHPCCRTRTGMTVADVLAYAPEHRPVIHLRRLAVPDDRWFGTAPPILLAHPWQAARLLHEHPWLTDLGPTGPVRPLMSLRTVAPLDGGPHIKTAVDIQMTSAVRTVSPAAVHNGPRLSALLTALTADLPLDILAETEAGAAITAHGPDRRLAHLVRQAPPADAIPLGVTTALLDTVHDPYVFMTGLADVLFRPLAVILARGVALEAHGQNTLVQVVDGRPVRTYYRDLGGVRVHPGRLGHDPGLHGDLPTDDLTELRTKMSAAALATVARQTITALHHRFNADPHHLWGLVAHALHGTPDTQALLTGPLPVKATTAMRLAANPLHDIWTPLDNPMKDHR